MAFGVTTEGFARKDLQTIKSEVEERQRDELGQELNQQADSLLGQLNSVVFNALAELWEVMEATYSSVNPDAASGQSLDNVSALTGTLRKAATKSTVLCDVNIDGSFTLPAGSVAFVPGNPSARFLLDADVVNSGGSPANFVGVAFTAETAGPVVANAGTLTGGPELVTGWNSCTNPLDATVGEDIETDAELRLRRRAELSGPGGSTKAAIRADVSKVEGVDSVSVVENFTNATVNGVPAKAFETIVLGGLDQDVAEAIFANKPVGIEAFGSTVVNVTDDEGNTVGVGLTRPAAVNVWLEFDLEVDGDYPVDGDDQVKAAVVLFAEGEFGQGDDIAPSKLFGPALGIAGVRNITELRLGFSASPTGTVKLPVALREIADFDTTRVTVSTTPYVDA